jgi:hypothetical protein
MMHGTQKLSMLNISADIKVVHTEYWCIVCALGIACVEHAHDEYGCITQNWYTHEL